LGSTLDRHQPQALASHHQEFAAYQIIISLQGPVSSYIEQIPFHTVALEWQTGQPASGQADLRLLSREIAALVSNLMTTLRGQESD
jgi:hypothetical protein